MTARSDLLTVLAGIGVVLLVASAIGWALRRKLSPDGRNEAVENLNDRIRAVGGRSEARLYPGLNHADLIATFSPLFRKKAPVLDDVTAFFHRQLG